MEKQELTGLLREIGRRVIAELSAEFPGIQPYVGPELAEQTGDPMVAELLGRGAPFNWVAFSFPGQRYWDAHVGCVVTEGRAFRVGFHSSDALWARLPQPETERVCAELGGTYNAVPLVDEQQYIGAPIEIERPDVAAAVAREAVRYYRALAPVMAQMATGRK